VPETVLTFLFPVVTRRVVVVEAVGLISLRERQIQAVLVVDSTSP
jgi:hypothetical protein